MDFGNTLSAPSRREQITYYCGLPSQPILVARTGTKKWTKTPEDLWGYYKFLAPLGRHPIIELWKEGRELATLIIDAIKRLHWVSVDILRVGESIPFEPVLPLENHPVVLFVTVKPGSATWEIAHPVALDCKAILCSFDLNDVDVEIKESEQERLASTDPAMDLCDDDGLGCLYSGKPGVFEASARPVGPYTQLVAPLRHLSDGIGTRLVPEAWMHHAGTKGLYLRVAPTELKPWSFEPCAAILTCRHVVFRCDSDTGKVYRWDGQPSSQRFVRQDVPTNQDIVQEVKDLVKGERLTQEKLDWHLMKFPDAAEKSRRLALEMEAEMARINADQVKPAIPILAQTKGLSIRVGHILFAQELSVTSQTTTSSSSQSSHPFVKGSWLRDYALVKSSNSVHTREPRNRLPISWYALHNAVVYSVPFGFYDNVRLSPTLRQQSIDQEAILSSEVIPEQEISELKQSKRVVGKFGAVSGLTFGIINEVKSITRHPITKNVTQNVPSWEVCVVGIAEPSRTSPGPPQAFSQPRDSGSAVWDLDGRILGIVTAGNQGDAKRGDMDVTYVTCMERILRDLEASGIQATIL